MCVECQAHVPSDLALLCGCPFPAWKVRHTENSPPSPAPHPAGQPHLTLTNHARALRTQARKTAGPKIAPAPEPLHHHFTRQDSTLQRQQDAGTSTRLHIQIAPSRSRRSRIYRISHDRRLCMTTTPRPPRPRSRTRTWPPSSRNIDADDSLPLTEPQVVPHQAEACQGAEAEPPCASMD